MRYKNALRIYYAIIILSLVLYIILGSKYQIWLYIGAGFLGVMISMHLFFLLGVLKNNHTFVDAAWGLSFIIVAHVTFWLNKNHTYIQWLVLLMVTIWGLRLFMHILSRSLGKDEDERYQTIRKSTQAHKRELVASYVRIYIIQGLTALIIAAPIVIINTTESNNILPLYQAGTVIWLLGFLFEVISDKQLKNFLSNKLNAGQIMSTGLWRYSRHPNYFGEATIWWGIFLIALSFDGGWLTFFGPLLITFLLTNVSGVPPAENIMKKMPGFNEYKRKTSKIIPWFPKKEDRT